MGPALVLLDNQVPSLIPTRQESEARTMRLKRRSSRRRASSSSSRRGDWQGGVGGGGGGGGKRGREVLGLGSEKRESV